MVVVIKRDGRRQPFDASKVRLGVEITLADRPVPQDAVDDLVATVERAAYTSQTSIHADEIGRIVLDGLKDLDEVGYLRFASVYKEFQTASDFEKEAARLDSPSSVNRDVAGADPGISERSVSEPGISDQGDPEQGDPEQVDPEQSEV